VSRGQAVARTVTMPDGTVAVPVSLTSSEYLEALHAEETRAETPPLQLQGKRKREDDDDEVELDEL
jgi:hypothetical protein